MKTESVFNKTGKYLNEWYEIIDNFAGRSMTHKSIASVLNESYSVNPWWSQTICVEYEKYIGRRIKGQTSDGLFQLGVSRTFAVDQQTLWESVIRESSLWTDINGPGVFERFSTFIDGSHFRMPWTAENWDSHSILQIRVQKASSPDKSICTVHQEKIPSLEDRSALKEHWNQILKQLSIA